MGTEDRARVRLGWALHDRADDVAAGVIARAQSFRPDAWLKPDPRAFDAIADADRLATRVLGRWLATGEQITQDEARQLAALGLLADTLSLSGLVKLYLAWRDVMLGVLEEEAGRLGTEAAIVDQVRTVIERSSDASLVSMTKQFDEERRRLQAELADEQHKLAQQALHDGLTGLPNRTLLLERIRHALEAAKRYGDSVALLFIDLDGFKTINDTLGHDAGDKVLLAMAGRLQQVVRPSDTVARLGGDEFVILCERLHGADEAAAIAERALDVLGQACRLGAKEVTLSASVGIALACGTEDPDTLLIQADLAMYVAKRRGGSDHETYESEIGQVALHRAALRQDLRQALDRGELTVHYQPVAHAGSTTVVSMEALVRWEHPERGTIAPAEFIPVAEEIGLIGAIDTWVLAQAARQGAAWRRDGWDVGVSVNVSVHDLDFTALESTVRSVLAETGLPPAALTLEITETGLLSDADAVVDALGSLASTGVRLAIDDFGVGYSSLSYLRRLPIDAVKLDRSFIVGLGSESQDPAVVAAIVDLAHTLGFSVVAEGVENEDELAEVRRLGCDEIQGYLLARPRPPAEIDACMRREAA
jgi:diguanylate cyclase (GGDEF)-like protein